MNSYICKTLSKTGSQLKVGTRTSQGFVVFLLPAATLGSKWLQYLQCPGKTLQCKVFWSLSPAKQRGDGMGCGDPGVQVSAEVAPSCAQERVAHPPSVNSLLSPSVLFCAIFCPEPGLMTFRHFSEKLCGKLL